MYHHFVPVKLHGKANALITDLKALTEAPTACPYCQHHDLYVIHSSSGYYRCKACKRSFNRSLNTPFYRLARLEWLPVIAERRLCGQSYATIRHELTDSTAWLIKRRGQVIEQYMQSHYPDLYQWYQTQQASSETDVPKAVKEQVEQLKSWVNNILQATQATCPHCESHKTQKVTDGRAQFRCKSCWRYFSQLKGTGLEHLAHSENWLKMIDMFVAGKSYQQMEHILTMSPATISKAKRNWLSIVQQQNLLVLKEWLTSR